MGLRLDMSSWTWHNWHAPQILTETTEHTAGPWPVNNVQGWSSNLTLNITDPAVAYSGTWGSSDRVVMQADGAVVPAPVNGQMTGKTLNVVSNLTGGFGPLDDVIGYRIALSAPVGANGSCTRSACLYVVAAYQALNVTEHAGVWIGPPTGTGFTTTYGLKVDPQISSGINYAIYTDLGGLVHFGDNTQCVMVVPSTGGTSLPSVDNGVTSRVTFQQTAFTGPVAALEFGPRDHIIVDANWDNAGFVYGRQIVLDFDPAAVPRSGGTGIVLSVRLDHQAIGTAFTVRKTVLDTVLNHNNCATGCVDAIVHHIQTQGIDDSIENLYGLKIENIQDALTLNYAIYTGVGAIYFGDRLTVKGAASLGPVNYGTDAGATDAYAYALVDLTAYQTGAVYTFKANTANTGGATLNVSGLGAKTLVKGVSTALVTGDILAGQICHCLYDGTNMVLLNPGSGSVTYAEGTWTPTFTGLTLAGGGTISYSGRWIQIGNTINWWIGISPAGGKTTSSAGGGATYCDNMPFTAGRASSFGVSNSSVVDLGLGVNASTRAYLPAWGASAAEIYISGTGTLI